MDSWSLFSERRFEKSAHYVGCTHWTGCVVLMSAMLIKLIATVEMNLARAAQILVLMLQLCNAIIALKLEVGRFLNWETGNKNIMLQRARHKYILYILRSPLQVSYSYFPISFDSKLPQIDHMIQLILFDGTLFTTTESAMDRTFLLFTWVDFPVYLFLDYRFAALNGVLELNRTLLLNIWHYFISRGATMMTTKFLFTAILPALRNGALKEHRWC